MNGSAVVLVDCEDGPTEQAWAAVDVAPTAKDAVALVLREWPEPPEGCAYFCDGEKSWHHPVDDLGDGYEGWEKSDRDAPGAIEFWNVFVVETDEGVPW